MAVLLSQKETWHVYFMNVIFFMNLSINFNSFQEVKKKKKSVVSQSLAIQAPCHFLKLYLWCQTLQIHKSCFIFCDMKETNLIVLQAPFQLYTFMMDSLTCLETINVTEASLLEMAKSKLFPGTSLVTQQLKKKIYLQCRRSR